MLKSIIIDDSRLARNELSRLLDEYPQVEVSAEAAHADEAKKLIEELKPDLIFLDIQMPGKDGFQLLEELVYTPLVIFTTAYHEYAIQAFEFNALDYLLKPVAAQRLAETLKKIEQEARIPASAISPDKLRAEDQVFVKDGERCWFVKLGEIRLIEVEENYSRVYFAKEQPMVHRSLNYLETRLDTKDFFRANRQQIINLKWIDRIEPWFSGSLKVFLKGGEEVEISRRQTSKFKELLSF